MPFFFEPFPTVNYDLKKNNKPAVLTNVTLRFKIQEILRSRSAVYYNYNVKDGERPDIIAYKYYGNASLDWIILLTNNIIDPFYDWPLGNLAFEKFIKSKYGSIANAQARVHHYEKILNTQSVLFDGTVIPERTVIVDQATYNTLSPSLRKVVYDYDYEEQLNLQRSEIKILDRRYVTDILNQVENVFA